MLHNHIEKLISTIVAGYSKKNILQSLKCISDGKIMTNIVCTWTDIEWNTKANQFADERTIQIMGETKKHLNQLCALMQNKTHLTTHMSLVVMQNRTVSDKTDCTLLKVAIVACI